MRAVGVAGIQQNKEKKIKAPACWISRHGRGRFGWVGVNLRLVVPISLFCFDFDYTCGRNSISNPDAGPSRIPAPCR